MKHFFIVILIFISHLVSAQTSIEKVKKYCSSHEHEMLKEYFRLLSLPNHALDKVNIDKNALFIESMLKKRGVKTQLL